MYITCPNCNAKFEINQEQIGDKGKKVRCSKCSNIWHQRRDNSEKIDPIIASGEAPVISSVNTNLPVLLPVKIPPILYSLQVFLMGMVIFMSLMLFPDLLKLNLFLNKNELTINDLQIKKDLSSDLITVSYKLTNSSGKNVKIPFVRIRLFDKNHKIIESKIDDYSKIELLSSQVVDITMHFKKDPREVDHAEVMLGNKLDFILR